MSDKTEKAVNAENEPPADVVEGSKRSLIGKSRYIIPAILSLSVNDLAKAQGGINLGSPPQPPLP